ncbi:MAG: TlpA family protein disulfide reductase [Thiobacillus sp.]|nr:TlpA family protein disulfide reductase [Thiobacillus sp.]
MRKLLLLLSASLVFSMSPAAGAEESTKAINFQFTDINGKSIQLSDFKGKWVLVNFWAPWCPLCWVEVPALNDMNKRKDFVVIGIGLDYGPDENIVKDASQRHDMDFHAVVAGGTRRNPDSPFRQVGPVDFYPTSYLYDPNGEIVMFIPGQVKISKVLAFMDNWGSKKNTQVAGSEEKRVPVAGSAVQEVTYTKPATNQAGAATKSRKSSKTTTY